MLATSTKVLFPAHNLLLTTGADIPRPFTLILSLVGAWAIMKVSDHQHRWLAGGHDLEIGHFEKLLAW